MKTIGKWIKKRRLIKSHKLTIGTYYRILIDFSSFADYCEHIERLIDHEIRTIKKLKNL